MIGTGGAGEVHDRGRGATETLHARLVALARDEAGSNVTWARFDALAMQ